MPRNTTAPKNKIISFRASDKMSEALRRAARKQGKSMADIVRLAFENWMVQHAAKTL
jgi:predicted DNA-binding protein